VAVRIRSAQSGVGIGSELVRNPQGGCGSSLVREAFSWLMKTTRKYLNRGVGGHGVVRTVRFPKYLTLVGQGFSKRLIDLQVTSARGWEGTRFSK
jgi:hypothetical protein